MDAVGADDGERVGTAVGECCHIILASDESGRWRWRRRRRRRERWGRRPGRIRLTDGHVYLEVSERHAPKD
jgi:hypothetical protein